MIPILFDENETNFISNGIGRLSDAISCIVSEERNGEYFLKMVYPIDGKHSEDINYSKLIYAVPSDGASAQPFRIYKISTPIDGKRTIMAHHISYQLSHIPVGVFSASNIADAFSKLSTHALEPCPFTFWTNKSTTGNFAITEPASIRSRLGGTNGSILDVYGGEYEFDNYTVKSYSSRGANRGVSLRYGKNITDLNQEKNIENTITGICPFWKDSSTGDLVTLPENVLYSSHANEYPYHRTKVVDFSSEFKEKPTVAQLRARAQSYITASGVGVPKINIKVSFVALWQTKEYENIANLERVKLCDTVNVFFEKLGINTTAKVIKTEYDVLMDRYTSITLGDAVSTLQDKVVSIQELANSKVSDTDLQQSINSATAALEQDISDAVDHATELIQGGLGGHVVINTNANGEPEEILVMDTADTSTAVNVIRINKNGIGFSTTGYSGTYTTAWTIDGHFNADWITTGILKSIDIQSVNVSSATITGSSFNNGNGTFQVDTNGNMKASSAEIKGTIKSGSTIEGSTITGSSFETPLSGGFKMKVDNSALTVTDANGNVQAMLSGRSGWTGTVTGTGLSLLSNIIGLNTDNLLIKKTGQSDFWVPYDGTREFVDNYQNHSIQAVSEIHDAGGGLIGWTTTTYTFPIPSGKRTATICKGLVISC